MENRQLTKNSAWLRAKSKFLSLFAGHKAPLYGLLAALYFIPLVVLLVLGIVFVWQQGWVLWFSLMVLGLSFLVFAVRLVLGKLNKQQAEIFPLLQAKSDWSHAEQQIWLLAKENIQAEQLAALAWTEIPQALLQQLTFVAECFHRDNPNAQYAFTVPEALLLCETVSRDYRSFIIDHIPLSQNIKVSTLRGAFKRKGTLTNIVRRGGYAYRLFRLSRNPLAAIANEVRTRFTDSLVLGLSERMQVNLKQALFEEVSQVGIDLYSGRLKLSDAELIAYRQQNQIEPDLQADQTLTVVVIGQINAGKSSLINALKDEIVAEVDVLPAGNGFSQHHCLIQDELKLILVDTPGIDGTDQVAKKLLNQATEADLLLWVCQANQPAKKLDQELFARWQAYFSAHLERRSPPYILVTTHNDKLSPVDQWNPPYDLSTSNDAKAANMLDALRYTQEVMGTAKDCAAVPVAMGPDTSAYNIDVLSDLIVELAAQAFASQLNKNRLNAAGSRISVKKTWQQSLKLGRVAGNLAFSTAKEKSTSSE